MYRVLVGKPEGKRPLEIPRRRWVDNIGCSRNSELIINKNNSLLKVIDTNFSTSQFTMVLNFFFT